MIKTFAVTTAPATTATTEVISPTRIELTLYDLPDDMKLSQMIAMAEAMGFTVEFELKSNSATEDVLA